MDRRKGGLQPPSLTFGSPPVATLPASFTRPTLAAPGRSLTLPLLTVRTQPEFSLSPSVTQRTASSSAVTTNIPIRTATTWPSPPTAAKHGRCLKSVPKPISPPSPTAETTQKHCHPDRRISFL